mmetsp:Transcript_92028/g.281627  ORF Transcript_92028/g.281627 Transcript_92028/m.281627 type:complete len:215 (-) Transcript_92028:392-1036(-)
MVMPSQLVKYPMMRPDTGRITKPPQHLNLWLLSPVQSPPLALSVIHKSIWIMPKTKPMTAETCWMKTNSRCPICKNIFTRSGLFSTSTSMAICLMSTRLLMLPLRSLMTGENMLRLSSSTFRSSSTLHQSGSNCQMSGQCISANLATTTELVFDNTGSKLEKKSSGWMRSMISSTVISVPIMMSHERLAIMCARRGTMPCQPRYGLQQPRKATG